MCELIFWRIREIIDEYNDGYMMIIIDISTHTHKT